MAEGHRARLKNRFLKEGLQNFEDYQALELLLFYAIPRQDVSPLARELIRHFGSFSAVLNAPVEELRKIPGMGEGSAAFLHLLPQMSQYYINDLHRFKPQILSSREAGDYLLSRFFGRTAENVFLLCLDSANRILYSDFISKGSVDFAAISVRSIVEIVLRAGATGVILAHNHPHGFALPSQADISSTRSLQQALRSIGVELLDHIIVAEGDYTSMKESGEMLNFEK